MLSAMDVTRNATCLALFLIAALVLCCLRNLPVVWLFIGGSVFLFAVSIIVTGSTLYMVF